MKTLKLSSIAFAFLCLISSCTKDSAQLSSQSNDQTMLSARQTLSGQSVKTGPANENPIPGNDKVVPEMTISFNPDPAILGEAVTVTGSFVQDGSTPDCGAIQLMMSTDGTTWTNVGQEKNVSATVQEVSYAFTPTLSGDKAYQFKLHYISSGPNCKEYDQGWSTIFYLDVKACQGLNLTRELVNMAPASNGLYEFTVAYTVTTCGIEFDKLKLQGGLTNATSIVEVTPVDDATKGIDYEAWVPGGSKNWIQRWEETSTGGLLPTHERKYTVKFTKAYSGSGPIELTGAWSVTLTKGGAEVSRKECAQINVQ
jgi:hypothetical protein